jgi:hypothetical protein
MVGINIRLKEQHEGEMKAGRQVRFTGLILKKSKTLLLWAEKWMGPCWLSND